MPKFDLVGSMEVDAETVRQYRYANNVGLIEAKSMAKANKLYSILSDMRYSIGDYEGKSTDEKFHDLLEILMQAVDL